MERLVLKKDTILYRGVASQTGQLLTEPMWFAIKENDAILYGKHVIKYQVLQDVTLFDPMTQAFQTEYIRTLNMKYTGINDDGVDIRKFKAALPFGLPCHKSQVDLLTALSIPIPNPDKWSIQHDIAANFINNKHRYSEISQDISMVSVLNEIFGTMYDGYITRLKWPTKLHNGMFMKEVFKPNGKLSQISPVSKGGKKQKGGFPNKLIHEHVPEGDSWNRLAACWDKRYVDQLRTEALRDTKDVKYVDHSPGLITYLD
jgi:hypothetical protein